MGGHLLLSRSGRGDFDGLNQNAPGLVANSTGGILRWDGLLEDAFMVEPPRAAGNVSMARAWRVHESA